MIVTYIPFSWHPVATHSGRLEAPGLVCRLHNPSGWLTECGEWPDPRWLTGLRREPIYPTKGHNGLAAIAEEVLKVSPCSGAPLIFVSES
jgi:hypothetical protein